MIALILLLLVGILLSAFFSGSETGFYRVSRVRLVLDGLDGDRVSQRLLWLTNHPALFVATTLVGNNVANYLTSLAMVLMAQRVFVAQTLWIELLTPILLAPVLFVFGESLPKRLFLDAPNKLLRRAGSSFIFFAFIFAPLSALLWALSRAIQKTLGRSPERVQLALARTELEELLTESQDAGILKPAQHELAMTLFKFANVSVTRYAIPPNRIVSIKENSKKSDVLKLARQKRISNLIVVDDSGKPIGYVRVIDLYLEKSKTVRRFKEPLMVDPKTALLDSLIKMQSEKIPVGFVTNPDKPGSVAGVVFEYQLGEVLGVQYGSES